MAETEVKAINGRTLCDDQARSDIKDINNALDKKQPAGKYITEEKDPTVPAWAKQPTKPAYTAAEVGARPKTWTPSASDVGADPSGTATAEVSGHNTNTDAHNDIRLLITGLTTRLNALANSDDTTLDQMAEVVAYIKSNRTLIESVTTSKVNVADIVNDLTTNVANKPLSAAQGVKLMGLIQEIWNANYATTSSMERAITLALASYLKNGGLSGDPGKRHLVINDSDGNSYRIPYLREESHELNPYNLPFATADSPGAITGAQFTKLESIEEGAQKNYVTNIVGSTPGYVDVHYWAEKGGPSGPTGEFEDRTVQVVTIRDGCIMPQVLPTVTDSANGVMTPDQKKQLESLSEEIANHQTQIDGKVDKEVLTFGQHTDGLYYVFENNVPIGTGVLIESTDGATGDVVGNVDSVNNIALSGSLPDGVYTFTWEMEDGTVVTIGTLDKNPLPNEPQIINYYDPETAKFNCRVKSDSSLVTGSDYYTTGTVGVEIPNFPILTASEDIVVRIEGVTPVQHTYNGWFGEIAFRNALGTIWGSKIALDDVANNAGASPQPLLKLETDATGATLTIPCSNSNWQSKLPMNYEGLTLVIGLTISNSSISSADCEGLQIYLPSQTIGG